MRDIEVSEFILDVGGNVRSATVEVSWGETQLDESR